MCPNKIHGDVEFKHVTFAYASQPGHPALEDVSFTIKAGSVTAVVGGSGAGKSTLVSLLLRLYDVDADSRISIDGIDVRELDVDWLRSQVTIFFFFFSHFLFSSPFCFLF